VAGAKVTLGVSQHDRFQASQPIILVVHEAMAQIPASINSLCSTWSRTTWKGFRLSIHCRTRSASAAESRASQSRTSSQIRAARSLIRWSAEDLARQSSLSVATIRRAELTEDETSMTVANDLAVRRALEAAGVEFIDENGGGSGVRLRKPGKKIPK
jgi:hypothetical protein